MAYYAYKHVRDLLPKFIIDKQGDKYEGDGNYDGDQWYAAEDYILYLQSLVLQHEPNHDFGRECEVSKT